MQKPFMGPASRKAVLQGCRLYSEKLTMKSSQAGRLLQDSRLNYIEQHAERMGLDADKLENLRVSASKASPMGDTLDLCARFATGQALDDLVQLSTRSLPS